MSRTRPIRVVVCLVACLAAAPVSRATADDSEVANSDVSFLYDVRPILSNNCFACHGPDENARDSGLRLDLRDEALDFGAIVPGAPEDSEAWLRITADDPADRMPPPEAHQELTDAEKEILRRWIAAGAEYELHWAYRPLVRPEAPQVDGRQPEHPIDAFVLRKLQELELSPAPAADRTTLVRRLYFDLLGLPPTPAETAAFVEDESPGAYEALVDRLLDDPHFGERMAVVWLDLVRYADTIGYHSDNAMEVSAYRDYVIDAFNANKPFDQFTTEQLAGDLLPNPTTEQRIASGYNRLLQTTEEGGAQAKEYRAIYAADRVRNVSVAWLGQTMGCAQCHDHKFDPITAKDFYSMAAFFADLEENAVGRRRPNLSLPTPEQAAEIRGLAAAIAALNPEAILDADAELADRVAASQAEWERSQDAEDPSEDSDDGELPQEVATALAVESSQRSDEQRALIAGHYRSIAPELEAARKQRAEYEQRLQEVKAGVRTMLVAEALAEPRTTRILPRGNWLDDSGEIVSPAPPEFLSDFLPTSDSRANRLDLARWIVHEANPLPARAFANRMWKHFFGQGISPSLDDLGGQGQPPTHPELLDYLAVEFRDDWDVKQLIRLLVTSEAYRRVSTPTPELLAADPTNAWWGRQGRWRLEAEFVRDAALRISGLLEEDQIGGPSVKPYQPVGYWQHLNFPQREWEPGAGADLHRRSLYTFWCRTFLHPSMIAFDAPSREECTAARARSNTPQQALVLLNDPIFVEAARVFAAKIAEQPGEPRQKIVWAWREALGREPNGEEVDVLVQLLDLAKSRYDDDVESSQALTRVGAAPVDESAAARETAAWTQIARAILNLYETTCRN